MGHAGTARRHRVVAWANRKQATEPTPRKQALVWCPVPL